ncbi:MAG: hypothetical protein V7L31_04215 [Nostoc sp.]
MVIGSDYKIQLRFTTSVVVTRKVNAYRICGMVNYQSIIAFDVAMLLKFR